MKKGIKLAIFLFVLFLIKPSFALAACDGVDEMIYRYNSLKKEYESYNCSFNNLNKQYIDEYGRLSVKAQYEACSEIAASLDSIATTLSNKYSGIEECENKIQSVKNDNSCEPLLNDFYDIVNRIMRYIYIIAPILLIIFVGVDLFNLLASGGSLGDKNSTKIKGNIFKRIIAFILLYITPTLITFIISFNGSEYNISGGDLYSCNKYRSVSLNGLMNFFNESMDNFWDIIWDFDREPINKQ